MLVVALLVVIQPHHDLAQQKENHEKESSWLHKQQRFTTPIVGEMKYRGAQKEKNHNKKKSHNNTTIIKQQ